MSDNHYTSVIIGDNADHTFVLKKNIRQHFPEMAIVAHADSIGEAKEVILRHKPHIALMNIELADATAFELLEDMSSNGSIDFEIIFFTTRPCFESAVKAIDFSSVALLTYPIKLDTLRGAIEKAKDRQRSKAQLDRLLKNHYTPNITNPQILISSAKQRKVAVAVGDITYFKAGGQTTEVYFQNGKSLTAFNILGHFKKRLLDNPSFFLVHYSLMVNVNQVQSYRYKELEITLKNGHKLFASRHLGKEFKKHWEELNSQWS